MLEETKPVVQDDPIPSGDDTDPKPVVKESVSYETHSRLLDQRKKDQVKFKDMETKWQEREALDAAATEKKLLDDGELKKVIDAQRSKIEELNGSLTVKDKFVTDTVKISAFMDKLPGKLLKHDYLHFVNLDKIAIDPDNSQVDDLTLNEVVNDFLKDHPNLVVADGKKLPADNAAASGGAMSLEDWKKLPTAELKRKHYDEVYQNYTRS